MDFWFIKSINGASNSSSESSLGNRAISQSDNTPLTIALAERELSVIEISANQAETGPGSKQTRPEKAERFMKWRRVCVDSRNATAIARLWHDLSWDMSLDEELFDMRVMKSLLLILLLTVVANLFILAQYNGLVDRVIRVVGRWLPEQSIPPTAVTNADWQLVVSQLRESQGERQQCRYTLGKWNLDKQMQLSHQEGAVVKTPGGYAMLSGFTHYVSGELMGTSRVDLLNQKTRQWQMIDIPAPTIVSHVQGARIGDFGWIAGGFIGQHPGKASNQSWRYSILDHSWQEGPPLPTPRASGALVGVENTLHYIGGLKADRQSDLAEHLTLNTSTKEADWQLQTTFTRARNHFQVVKVGGLLYAVGGQIGHDKSVRDLPWLDVWVPSQNRWLPLQDMPEGRSHAEMATFVHDDHIFVVGGRTAQNSETPEQSIIAYDVRSGRWQSIGDLPVPLISPFARVVDQHLYVAGGGLNWNRPQSNAWRAALSKICD